MTAEEEMTDFNKMTIKEHIEHLESKFQFDSSGTAKSVFELIKAYKTNKESSKELVEALENFIKAVKNEDIIIQDNVDSDGFGSTGSYLYRMAEKAIENHLK